MFLWTLQLKLLHMIGKNRYIEVALIWLKIVRTLESNVQISDHKLFKSRQLY